MRQAVMTEPGKIEFGEAEEPKPGAGEILLRIKRIGVCGSDIHVYHGKHPFTPYPVVQGHEYSGVVEAVGEGVKDVELGELATARWRLYSLADTCYSERSSAGEHHGPAGNVTGIRSLQIVQ